MCVIDTSIEQAHGRSVPRRRRDTNRKVTKELALKRARNAQVLRGQFLRLTQLGDVEQKKRLTCPIVKPPEAHRHQSIRKDYESVPKLEPRPLRHSLELLIRHLGSNFLVVTEPDLPPYGLTWLRKRHTIRPQVALRCQSNRVNVFDQILSFRPLASLVEFGLIAVEDIVQKTDFCCRNSNCCTDLNGIGRNRKQLDPTPLSFQRIHNLHRVGLQLIGNDERISLSETALTGRALCLVQVFAKLLGMTNPIPGWTLKLSSSAPIGCVAIALASFVQP